MEDFSLDQFAVLVSVVDGGSFVAAARHLNRAQSAITYAIKNLEEESGVTLFDRSGYRPVLTEAGRALLPRARRVLASVTDYRLQARGFREGLEAELSLVVDSGVPLKGVLEVLKELNRTFPALQLRLAVESLGGATRALSEGRADIGLLPDLPGTNQEFERNVCGEIELVPVAAPDHPLATVAGPIQADMLYDHVQLVLTGRHSMLDARELGVSASIRWYVADAETKYAMLIAGLGWGSMPRERVAADLAAGRLVELHPVSWDGRNQMPRFAFVVAHRKDRLLGLAGCWLAKQLEQYFTHHINLPG